MRTTIDEKKRAMIDDLVMARTAILELARTFPGELEAEHFLGVWSIKDLIAHLIGWDKTNIEAITEIMEGNYPTFLRYYDKDWKTYNEQLVRVYRKASLAALLKDAEASHGQFMAFLDALPADTVVKGKVRSETGRTITIANLLRAEATDERGHAIQVGIFLSAPEVAPNLSEK
jgi:hypothetical protein